jgi:fido (protein-threonine AMPylation protein)/DNA-binding CsgD family transcriptional regulator
MTDFEEYIRQGEPLKKEKGYAWLTAIGLQDVDGLKPSSYLIETAKQNIEGEITIAEVKNRIDSYYKAKHTINKDDRTEEADKVSAHIAEILSEKTFTFSPVEYINIHKRLFTGLFKFAGKIRDYNITKSEWALNGKTVFYASADSIRATLEFDFAQEKSFSYKGLTLIDTVRHFTKFVSGVWQIHAFGEGNTRTTAVFVIKYLRTFGFDVTNDIFSQHSWFFRNALVRANYNDFKQNIHATPEYLERFFRNFLLGENNILQNRELVIDKNAEEQENTISKSNICTLEESSLKDNCTLEEHFVLKFLAANPKATQKEIAAHIRKSERTVKSITSSLQQKHLLERLNGYWSIIN